MDHRLFCLELLRSYITKEQALHFVENGGFRILRRWMKSAEDSDNLDELRFILTVCEKLPFVESAVRQAEIGKSIKRISKHVSSTGRNIHELHATANRVMELWKQQMRVTQGPTDAPSKAVNLNTKVATSKVDESANSNKSATTLVAEGSKLAKTANEAKETSNEHTITKVAPNVAQPAAAAASAPKSTRLIDLIRRSEPIAASAASSVSPFSTLLSTSSAPVTASSVPLVAATAKSMGEKRERRSLDMEASAKKLLESRQLSQKSGNAESDAGDNNALGNLMLDGNNGVAPLSVAVILLCIFVVKDRFRFIFFVCHLI